ncbi:MULTISPECIES: SprT family protein [Bacteria]|jgi:SprT-like protein|uniref:Protein SprT-like n=1 Tax=Rossellomorea aquimaris TaxID=189382 RepID=A0A5D4TIW6_9BACI|nr:MULTISPECIES: SprT family protein [Rossellomorea]MDT9027595.1 SprT family protein [Rossellomorea sp. YC4-1]TYS74064.1 SprT family protein [Rossellomorea aquimaris]TYS78643.1 SprT family protein [Rossellomorea aquimaris]TYS84985.1 SprT family protein [Rossellomorea aquimaris]
MTDAELQFLVEKISIQSFHKPFLHKAYFNPRLRTTGGRYMLGSHNIDINRKYLDEHGMDELIGIIKHELCHYHLHIEGKGYKHGDEDFKRLLNEVGGPRHCSILTSVNNRRRYLIYECSKCGLEFKRRRKINLRKYVCGRCKGRLKLVKEVIMKEDKS